MMVAFSFSKVEGLGNDFVLLARLESRPDELATEISHLRHQAPQICDRRTGIGADGLLLLATPLGSEANARMIVINRDGSRPEMCGNGLRCAAHYMTNHLAVDHVALETDAGLRRCEVEPDQDFPERAMVRVAMGNAGRLTTTRPAAAPGRVFIGVSVGNPHAVHFVAATEDPEALARRLGPQIETDPLYPNRTNVGFAKVDHKHHSIELWVWERGCGLTSACGTGACAAVVAAQREGLIEGNREVRVTLPRGQLFVCCDHDDVWMRGPARKVFEGQFETN